MDWLSEINRLIPLGFQLTSGCVLLSGVIYSFWLWVKSGFKAPLYIHIIANISGLIAIILTYLSYSSDASNTDKVIWLILIFPLSVYLIFAIFGGGHIVTDSEWRRIESPSKSIWLENMLAWLVQKIPPFYRWLASFDEVKALAWACQITTYAVGVLLIYDFGAEIMWLVSHLIDNYLKATSVASIVFFILAIIIGAGRQLSSFLMARDYFIWIEHESHILRKTLLGYVPGERWQKSFMFRVVSWASTTCLTIVPSAIFSQYASTHVAEIFWIVFLLIIIFRIGISFICRRYVLRFTTE